MLTAGVVFILRVKKPTENKVGPVLIVFKIQPVKTHKKILYNRFILMIIGPCSPIPLGKEARPKMNKAII